MRTIRKAGKEGRAEESLDVTGPIQLNEVKTDYTGGIDVARLCLYSCVCIRVGVYEYVCV